MQTRPSYQAGRVLFLFSAVPRKKIITIFLYKRKYKKLLFIFCQPFHRHTKYLRKHRKFIIGHKAGPDFYSAYAVPLHCNSCNLQTRRKVCLRDIQPGECFFDAISAKVLSPLVVVYFQPPIPPFVLKVCIFLDFNTISVDNCVKGQNPEKAMVRPLKITQAARTLGGRTEDST